jgi:hypothetical protein
MALNLNNTKNYFSKKMTKNQNRYQTIVFRTSLEDLEKIYKLYEAGKLSELIKGDILDLGRISESFLAKLPNSSHNKTWIKLRQWFEGHNLEKWNYEEVLLGTVLALKNSLDDSSAFAASMNQSSEGSQTNQILTLFEELAKEEQNSIRKAAQKLGEIGNESPEVPEVIEALVNRLSRVDDQETIWQIALTLSKLDPTRHPQAVAQRQKIQLAKHKLQLLVGIKQGEDEQLDIILQVSSIRKPYLPSGLELTVLDESEAILLTTQAREETAYLSLSFSSLPSQKLTVKISWEDENVREDFEV